MNSGWNVCWWSAWAIIFWKNINTASDANIVWLVDTQGLHMTKNTSIWCHYKERKEYEIKEYISNHHIDVIALYETTWLIIQNDSIKAVGDWNVVYYSSTNKKIYNMNQFIELL